jgi:hypothetical protein
MDLQIPTLEEIVQAGLDMIEETPPEPGVEPAAGPDDAEDAEDREEL